MLREIVAEFARAEVEPQAAEHDREGTLQPRALPPRRRARPARRHGARERGGPGSTRSPRCIVHHELAKVDPGLLARLPRARDPVREQLLLGRERRAARRATCRERSPGEWIGGMGMTEPGVGTDVLGMQTHRASATATSTCSTAARRSSPTAPRAHARVLPRLRARSTARDHRRSSSSAACPGFSTGRSRSTRSACAPRPWPSSIFDDCACPPRTCSATRAAASPT